MKPLKVTFDSSMVGDRFLANLEVDPNVTKQAFKKVLGYLPKSARKLRSALKKNTSIYAETSGASLYIGTISDVPTDEEYDRFKQSIYELYAGMFNTSLKKEKHPEGFQKLDPVWGMPRYN